MKTESFAVVLFILALVANGCSESPPRLSERQREIVNGLYSSDVTERVYYSMILQESRAASYALPRLLVLLNDDSQVLIRRRGWRPDPSAKTTNVGFEAAKAVVNIGEKSVEPLLALLDSGSTVAQKNAAWAAGEIGDTIFVTTLIPLLHAEREPADEAMEALRKIGDPRAVEPLIGVLLAGTEYPSPIYRPDAARALADFQDDRVVPALTEALGSDDFAVRLYAAGELCEVGDPRAEEALRAALSDEGRGVRSYAAKALRRLESPPTSAKSCHQ